MQNKKNDDKELICVNVDKVYDWIVRENTFDIFPGLTVAFPGLPVGTALAGATVTCDVTPAPGPTPPPIEIISREDRQFCIDGKNVCLQQLTIRKNFELTLTLTLATGVIFVSTPIAFSRNELVTLCAPEGTDVEITFTEIDCFLPTVTLPDTAIADAVVFLGLVVTVTTCQSIQSTFPVTVELLADFCQPREDFITVCPPPGRPPQCPSLFPDDGHNGHNFHNGHNCQNCHNGNCH